MTRPQLEPVAGDTAMAFRLYPDFVGQGGSFVYSPYSIASAFAKEQPSRATASPKIALRN